MYIDKCNDYYSNNKTTLKSINEKNLENTKDELAVNEMYTKYPSPYGFVPMFQQAYQMHPMSYSPLLLLPPSLLPAKDDPNVKNINSDIKSIDSGAIKPCLFKYVYIWQTNGQSYWSYLTFVGKRSVAGWRWICYRWVYFGIDLCKIEAFICY